jgi:carbohydrate kinase (thermoresistant glucokinase family)
MSTGTNLAIGRILRDSGHPGTGQGTLARAGDRRVVLIGVSGSGKTAIGTRLAAQLGWRFIDADDLHPPANIAKMAAGVPLTDDDRRPWLAEVTRQLDAGHDAVAACSALRRPYRDIIASAVPGVFFVQLSVPAAALAARMRARKDHFMPVSLLDSQLATFEPLGPDEPGTVIDASRDLDTVVAELAVLLTRGAPPGPAGATARQPGPASALSQAAAGHGADRQDLDRGVGAGLSLERDLDRLGLVRRVDQQGGRGHRAAL